MVKHPKYFNFIHGVKKMKQIENVHYTFLNNGMAENVQVKCLGSNKINDNVNASCIVWHSSEHQDSYH